MSIEQALFTSTRSDRCEGYHVVARSPGVDDSEAQELAAWCPSHDGLQEPGPTSESINFHPLGSGRYCLSQTVAGGGEYSDSGGAVLITRCLIVPADVLARFANNPFSL